VTPRTMPAMADDHARGAPDVGHDPAGPGLELAPFRALRFGQSRVGDLAAVTAPPYDVVDTDVARRLKAGHPNNIVRLILPEGGSGAQDGRYDRAGRTLRSWVDEGVLVRDPLPALYVYEQVGASVHQRGLIGGVGLRRPDAGIVLPHEDTMPGPVDDRLRLMRATQANLEPIFLLTDGLADAAELIEKTAAGLPLYEATTADGVTHRLWRMTDATEIRRVSEDLRPRQALIADGHHRYATYLRLQQEMRASGHGAGPWDHGLALLVDRQAYPPVLGAIHRVVHGLERGELVRRTGGAFRARDVESPRLGPGSPRAGADDPVGALPALAAARDDHAFVLTDASGATLLSSPDPSVLARTVPPDRPEPWRRLDATVLHSTLLDALWGVPDDERSVSYHHDLPGALRAAEQYDGTAVLMNPVPVESVLEVTGAGARMPRKSTSFGPKPRTGLVLRTL